MSTRSGRSDAVPARGRALAALLVVALLPGCMSTQTVRGGSPAVSRELHLQAGDVVKLITVNRERFRIRIVSIGPESMRGEVLKSKQSTLPPGGTVDVAYADMALLQEEHLSATRTTGAVLGVGLIGAMVVAFIAIGAAPVMAAPPP